MLIATFLLGILCFSNCTYTSIYRRHSHLIDKYESHVADYYDISTQIADYRSLIDVLDELVDRLTSYRGLSFDYDRINKLNEKLTSQYISLRGSEEELLTLTEHFEDFKSDHASILQTYYRSLERSLTLKYKQAHKKRRYDRLILIKDRLERAHQNQQIANQLYHIIQFRSVTDSTGGYTSLSFLP